MNDRALQDEVIHYLTDARARRLGLGGLPISPAAAERAGRFARFAARHYYRDRMARSFQYSQRFRAQTGRVADEVVDGPEFDALLLHCVMGSLESARHVGELARQHLAGVVPHPTGCWLDLLDYEYAYFLQAATSELGARSRHPARGLSACCRRFSRAMPDVIARIREQRPLNDDPNRPTTLLFSRTQEGKIFVLEIEDSAAAVFRACNGARPVEQIASVAGVVLEQAQQVLQALAGVGAILNGASDRELQAQNHSYALLPQFGDDQSQHRE